MSEPSETLRASEFGWKAKLIFVALVVLLCGVNGLNVLNSFVGRNFMTSIANRDNAEFMRQAVFYVGVFAGSTVVAVIAKFAEERLGLLWRESLTRRAIRTLSRRWNLLPFGRVRRTCQSGPADRR